MDREVGLDIQNVVVDPLRVEGLILSRKADGRQVYDARAKAALVKLCRKPGVSIARAAMENGVNANLLRKWMTTKRVSRSKGKSLAQSGQGAAKPESSQLLPVVLKPGSSRRLSPGEVRSDIKVSMTMEVELARGIVRIGSVDARALHGVIELLLQRDR